MKPIFVIAGNHREFHFWCNENRVSSSSPLVKYIPEGEGNRVLFGIKNPEIVCFGTYNQRKDFRELENLVREKTRVEVQVKIVYVEPPKKKVEFVGECFRKVSWRVPA